MFVVHMIFGVLGGLAAAGGAVYAGASIWGALAIYVAAGNIVFLGSLVLAMVLLSGETDEAEMHAGGAGVGAAGA